MKLLKKLTTMMLGAALLCTMVMVPEIKAHADGPVTWYITYTGGKWFTSNNTINWWTEGMNAVADGMKDGDHIVINADNQTTEMLSYTVNKRIGDLVVTNGAVASVTAPYAERVYVAGKGTIIATVGLANNVEVWPGQTVQIIGDVTNFVAHYEYGKTEYPVFGASGFVKAANVNHTGAIESSNKTIYGIAPGLFASNNEGIVTLKENQYSTVPVEKPVTGTTTAPAAADPSKKQLDKVPQTGTFASTETIVFLMLAAIFGIATLVTASVVKKRA